MGLSLFIRANRFNPISEWLVDFYEMMTMATTTQNMHTQNVANPKGICETIEFYRAEKALQT